MGIKNILEGFLKGVERRVGLGQQTFDAMTVGDLQKDIKEIKECLEEGDVERLRSILSRDLNENLSKEELFEVAENIIIEKERKIKEIKEEYNTNN